MELTVHLHPRDLKSLETKARAEGTELADYASRVLQREAQKPSLDEVLAPVRARFNELGGSEDAFTREYEEEKHAQRGVTSDD